MKLGPFAKSLLPDSWIAAGGVVPNNYPNSEHRGSRYFEEQFNKIKSKRIREAMRQDSTYGNTITWYKADRIIPKTKESVLYEHGDGFSVGTFQTGLFIEDNTNDKKPPKEVHRWAFLSEL